MDELRIRFEKLVCIRKQQIRTCEHTTYNQLLYRNRSQHRKGLYFRRLEHVRRLLAKLNAHVVWQSVQSALGPEQNNTSKVKSNLPLALSSMILDDLKSVQQILELLVEQVLPKAAIRITVELISRQHFLPFAIAILALMARIFVIERTLLNEIRGSIVEMKLVLGEHANVGICHQKDASKQDTKIAEDIGEEVSIGKSTNVQKGDKEGNTLNINAEANDMKMKNAQNLSTKRKSNEAPSLYAFMAKFDKSAAAIAASTAKPVVVNVESAIVKQQNLTSLADSEPISDKMAKSTKRKASTITDYGNAVKLYKRESQDVTLQETGVEQSISGKTDMKSKEERLDDTNEASSEESEDIDDIFGALED